MIVERLEMSKGRRERIEKGSRKRIEKEKETKDNKKRRRAIQPCNITIVSSSPQGMQVGAQASKSSLYNALLK